MTTQPINMELGSFRIGMAASSASKASCRSGWARLTAPVDPPAAARYLILQCCRTQPNTFRLHRALPPTGFITHRVSAMKWTDRIGRRLKLHDLHTLMTVAESGSMGKAAKALGISQSSVSKTISDI